VKPLFPIVALALAFCGPSAASAPPRVWLAEFETVGLSTDVAEAVKQRLVDDVGEAGLSVLDVSANRAGCVDEQACRAEMAEKLGTVGTLRISVMRAGPVAQVSITIYRADGAEAHRDERVVADAELLGEAPLLAEGEVAALGALGGTAAKSDAETTAPPKDAPPTEDPPVAPSQEAEAPHPVEDKPTSETTSPPVTETDGGLDLPWLTIGGFGLLGTGLAVLVVGAALAVPPAVFVVDSSSEGSLRPGKRIEALAWMGVATVGAFISSAGGALLAWDALTGEAEGSDAPPP